MHTHTHTHTYTHTHACINTHNHSTQQSQHTTITAHNNHSTHMMCRTYSEHVWSSGMLSASRPRQCVCCQSRHVLHWTIAPSSMCTPHGHLQLIASRLCKGKGAQAQTKTPKYHQSSEGRLVPSSMHFLPSPPSSKPASAVPSQHCVSLLFPPPCCRACSLDSVGVWLHLCLHTAAVLCV